MAAAPGVRAPPLVSCRWWVLVLAAWLVLVVDGRHHDDERLIGWKGETHRVDSAQSTTASATASVCVGRNARCHGVDAASARRINRYGEVDVASHYIATYDALGDTYTHMAMIEALPNGTLLAVWQAGVGAEGTADQHFVTSYSLDGAGTQWSLPTRLREVGGDGFALWGPTLFADKIQQRLWLVYSQNTGACHSNYMHWPPGGDIKQMVLDLQTGQWGAPTVIYSQAEDGGIPKVTANKIVELSSGVWLLPFWREKALVAASPECATEVRGKQSAGVLRSTDRGRSWSAAGALTADHTWLIENAVAESPEGTAVMVFRTSVGRVYAARSTDDGRTWSQAAPLAHLPNPNSKIDLVSIEPNRELVLVYNNHAKARTKVKVGMEHYAALTKGGCRNCRTFLTVAVSSDHGATWREVASIESEVGESLRMHYPTLARRGCEVLVAYSRFHKTPVEPGTVRFADQGIKVASVPLCGL